MNTKILTQTINKSENIGEGIIISIYLILKPIYLWNSGSLQISDLFLMSTLIYLTIKQNGVFRFNAKISVFLKAFLGMCLYIGLINTMWTLALDNNILKSITYYLFNFISTIIFVVIGQNIGMEKMKKAVLYGVFFSLIISNIGVLVSIGSGRSVGYFNNPNQLGYYGLVLFSLILFSNDQTSFIIMLVMSAMSIWVIIASSSKAAFIGVLFLSIVYILANNKGFSVKYVALGIMAIVLLGTVIYLVLYSQNENIVNNHSISMMRRRLFSMSEESDSSLGEGRGYNRIKELGINFLWGMGEGAYTRFFSLRGNEVHSTYINMFVSYGLIGFIWYVYLILYVVVNRRNKSFTIANFAVLSGVILYQVYHNGIRSTLFWLLIVLILLQNSDVKSQCHFRGNYSKTT